MRGRASRQARESAGLEEDQSDDYGGVVELAAAMVGAEDEAGMRDVVAEPDEKALKQRGARVENAGRSGSDA